MTLPLEKPTGGDRSRRGADSLLRVPRAPLSARPGYGTFVKGDLEASRAAAAERKRASRARHYVEPEPLSAPIVAVWYPC